MSTAATGVKEADDVSQPIVSRPIDVWVRLEKHKLSLCLALFAATLLFYNPITHNAFLQLDDDQYIFNNPPVLAGLTWHTVKWSFTNFHDANWHPLTWLSHALDCQLFGVNPVGHHYVNVLIHAGNAVLLFLLLAETTAAVWPSLLVAALFALHPMNVESVAWAAERKNVLSMFFCLLAMWAYSRYARRGGIGRYALVVLLFALGLMAKPQVITLPCLLLLWDYWPLGRMFAKPDRPAEAAPPKSFKFLLLEKVPLLVPAALSAIITVKAQESSGAVRTFSEVLLSARIENAIISYARYLGKLFVPIQLAPLYPHPGNSISWWQVLGSAALLAGITGLLVRERKRKYLALGWLWFLGVLVPMIGIIQVGEQAMADRYMYIPMIGILISVVWFVWEIASEKSIPKVWIAAPAALIVAVLGVLTYRQLSYWKNGETLWRYTLNVTKDNYTAHANLAIALQRQGRVEEAIPEFQTAQALHAYPLPQVLTLAMYEQRYGHLREAVETYQKVVSHSADQELRAAALTGIGSANLQMKDYDQAKLSYQEALAADPKNVTALVGSGLMAERNGDIETSVAQLARAANLRPDDVGLLLLADALRRENRLAEAAKAEAYANKISPDWTQAQQNTAQALAAAGLSPQ